MPKKKGYRAPKGSAERAARDLGAAKRKKKKRLDEIMGKKKKKSTY